MSLVIGPTEVTLIKLYVFVRKKENNYSGETVYNGRVGQVKFINTTRHLSISLTANMQTAEIILCYHKMSFLIEYCCFN